MPQNTPMKRQFTTIDGRTVMSNLPQHWGGNDWAITGVDNPLPVGNYVQTEAGVWIPQKGSDDGAADVRLTGSNVEKINITQEVGIIPAGGNKRININVPQRTKSISLYIRALAGRISSAHIEFRNLNPSYGSPTNSIELTPVANLPSSAPVFKKEELVSDSVGIRIEADSGTDVELQFAIVYCWRD